MTAAARRLTQLDRRAIIAAALLGALLVAAILTGALARVTEILSGDREEIRASLAGLGAAAPFASIGLNVLQGVIAPIPGFVVPFINGMVFGTWAGMLITWIGGIAAASACFGISRTIGRGIAERLCRRSAAMERANQVLERHGLGAIILARSLPGMPFDAFSYLGGLSRVSYRTFALGTAVGSAPHALAYSLLGSHLSVPLWMGLAVTPLVGVAVALVHWTVTRARRAVTRRATTAAPTITVTQAIPSRRRPCPTPASVTPAGCAARVAVCPTGWASGRRGIPAPVPVPVG